MSVKDLFEKVDQVENAQDIDALFVDMLADDKKSIDIARALLTKIMISNDDYTDLDSKQVIHLSILEGIVRVIKSPFLEQLIVSFKRLRKSHKRQDRKEAVKMVQSLKEEQEGLQSKFRNLLGVGN